MSALTRFFSQHPDPFLLALSSALTWYLNQVVEVVLPSDPAIVGLQTVRLVGDVFYVRTFTVVELPLEQLESDRERQSIWRGI